MESRSVNTNAPFATDHSRWQAVVDRDVEADGVFVYGVTSTGIYCRPTCPSRRPLRTRVRFFRNSDEATHEGFRACKRCHPEEQSMEASFVERVVEAIEGWSEGRPTLADLAEITGMSPGHVQRKFKALTGVSPAEFSRHRQVERFRTELKGGHDVTTSMYEAGFGSSAALYEQSERELGMSPATLRQGARGQELHYATASSTLGRVLVAYTAVGVALITFGDTDDELLTYLHQEYPAAEIIGDVGPHPWLQAILDVLAGESTHPDVPLDIRGTAFQRRVWQAIQAIPPGETRSYKEVAAAIGAPDAARAVANACGQNRLALAIPCHRVVRADGSTGGYRWGIERKTTLLARESAG